MNEWMMIMPVFAVKAWLIVTIIVIIALVAGLVALSIYGRKLQTRQEESQKQLQAAAQNASFLVIVFVHSYHNVFSKIYDNFVFQDIFCLFSTISPFCFTCS